MLFRSTAILRHKNLDADLEEDAIDWVG